MNSTRALVIRFAPGRNPHSGHYLAGFSENLVNTTPDLAAARLFPVPSKDVTDEQSEFAAAEERLAHAGMWYQVFMVGTIREI